MEVVRGIYRGCLERMHPKRCGGDYLIRLSVLCHAIPLMNRAFKLCRAFFVIEQAFNAVKSSGHGCYD